MGLTKPRAAQIYDIDYKQATRTITVANVTLAGGAPNQVDGINLTVNDRVLVTGQSDAKQNGLYYVENLGTGANGTWLRTSDGNETGEIEAGMIVMVTEGTTYADTQWKLITDNPIVIGVTELIFTQNYSANSISAGSSNVSIIANANVNISSNGTANVVAVSNTGAYVTGVVSATGNITGNYVLGNGSQLTGISVSSSRIFNGNSEANIGTTGGNANVSIGGTSNVAVFANTGIYITGEISATGNIFGGGVRNTTASTPPASPSVGDTWYDDSTDTIFRYVYDGNNYFWQDISGGSIAANVAGSSSYANANAVAYGESGWAGNIIPSGNAVYNLGNATNQWKELYVSNTTIYIGNVAVSTADGNLQVAGNAVVTANATGTSTTTGNVNITGNVTGGNLSAQGNITGNYILGNGALLTGVSTSSSNINNGTSNVTVVSSGGNITASVAGVSNVMVLSNTIANYSSMTGGFIVPTGNTNQRPASPAAGTIRYNTTTNQTEIWSGVSWLGITNQSYAVDYLIVAGGAAGGVRIGGGGGAGGLLLGTSTLTAGTTYTIIVGAGGPQTVTGGSETYNTPGINGSNSTAFGLTAIGGGGGAGTDTNTGVAGGSGGGGSRPGSAAGGAGTSGQGYAGGASVAGVDRSGGGGGAGAVGAAGNVSGNGGIGVQSSITGTATYYAGGGGGSSYSTTGGSGGLGGGGAGGTGNGSTVTIGTAGTVNTGGGGGGGGYAGSNQTNAAGGSGVVILSVPTDSYSGTTTGSPTITTSGSNTIIKFTASGSYTAQISI